MFLSTKQLRLLTEVMQSLAEPYDEHEIRARTGQLMLQLLDAQYYASYVWQPAIARFDGRIQIGMDSANLLQYERYYQFHDPITPALQRHRSAVRVSDVMPQCDLVRTEFFNDFLARDGLHWGVNLYAWVGDQNIGDMRIWRDRRHENFSSDDLQLLDLVRPVFTAALNRCRLGATADHFGPRLSSSGVIVMPACTTAFRARTGNRAARILRAR